jgi:hypothetical protein
MFSHLDSQLNLLRSWGVRQRWSIGMAPLIELKIRAWKIQAMHICIMIVEQGNSNHNYFEGEIVLYRNA